MSDVETKEILTNFRNITVVGISSNTDRASHHVSEYLIEQGYQVDGVHPKEKSVLGRPVYASLQEVPHPLEIVDVFRASDHIPALIEELIPLKPKAIWLQEGVTHKEAEEKARNAGIFVISNKCILKEHRRLIDS